MRTALLFFFLSLALLFLSFPPARSDFPLSPSFPIETRDGEGEGEGEDVKTFKCSRTKGTYATLLQGLYSVSLPARVVIFFDCNVVISPAVAYDAYFNRMANGTATEVDASMQDRSISTATSFPCDLYPNNYFPSRNYYICGYASQESKTGARYYGRNFGINCPWCGSSGLLSQDGGSCSVKDDSTINCFFILTTAKDSLLYSAELEKVSDDVDDDIRKDINNPKWDFKECGVNAC